MSECDVMREGYGKRGLRKLGAVGKLAHKEMVARIEGAFHRGRRDLESLEEENVDEGDEDHRKDDRVEPIQPDIVLFAFLIFLFPEKPLDFLGNEEVEKYYKSEEPPPVSKPDHPRNVQDRPEAEPEPLAMDEILETH